MGKLLSYTIKSIVLILLLSGCAKKPITPTIEPVKPVVIDQPRKINKVTFIFSTKCQGYEMSFSAKSSDAQGYPFITDKTVKTKTSGSYSITTDANYILYSFIGTDKPIGGNTVYCDVDLEVIINDSLKSKITGYSKFNGEIKLN